MLPPITWPLVPMNGDTARTDGHSSARAAASAAVSVVTEPERTPPLWPLDGSTMMTLEPSVLNWSCTSWPAPWPMDTMVVTAAMPMTTPSTVRPERSLFLPSVRKEMTSRSSRSTASPRREGAFRAGHHGLAVGEVAVHQLRVLVLHEAQGDGDGPQQGPVRHPDDAVPALVGLLGLLAGRAFDAA